MRRIGGERNHTAAWVEARGELRENFNTESNREEDKVVREKTLMRNMKKKRGGRVRHKAQSEVAFCGVA